MVTVDPGSAGVPATAADQPLVNEVVRARTATSYEVPFSNSSTTAVRPPLRKGAARLSDDQTSASSVQESGSFLLVELDRMYRTS